jgi:hypothetical protein
VFDASGSASVIKNLGSSAEVCFCQGGSVLLTSDGSLVHVASGRVSALVPRPA